MLLNKAWKRKIIKTEYVSERITTTTIKWDQRKIELTSVYFTHSGYADMHMEKMHKNIEDPLHQQKNILGSWRATSTLSSDLDLDETVVDDSELCCAQNNIQKTPEKTPSDPRVGKSNSWTVVKLTEETEDTALTLNQTT